MNRQTLEAIGYVDYTWNPLTGCLNNCGYCYGRRLAQGRLKSMYLKNMGYVLAGDPADPYAIRFWPKRLVEPTKVSTPSRIFVVDMGDLFGDLVPQQCLDDVLKIVRACSWHTFLFLTKYPWNLKRVIEWPDNSWVGVTACNNRMAEHALYNLGRVKAPVRFISYEPMLGSLERCTGTFLRQMFKTVNWIIMGPETPTVNTMSRDPWIEEVVKAADRAGVPIYMKYSMKQVYPGPFRAGFP